MKHSIFFITTFLISASAFAATDFSKEAIKLVPEGTVQSTDREEVTIKTKAGSIVEVELDRDGKLDEASGSMAQKDNFVPGNGLLSLSDAVATMKKEGKTVDGEWSLDRDLMRDWEYEFEGVENGKQYEYTMNAKSGKLVKSEVE